MSSIQSVTPNLQSNNFRKQKKRTVNPSFGENPAGLSDEAFKIIRDGVESKVNGKMGLAGKTYKWLASTSGEIQTQIINAIFTSTLAPAFIAFNPLSKQDEKTKKYTALRQPISAIIALTGGLAMTMANDSYIDKMYNEGFVESIDLRAKPSDSYLKSKFKKEPEFQKGNRIWSPFLSSEQKKNLENYMKIIKDQREKLFTTLHTEESKEGRFLVNANKEILLDGVKIGENIPNLETQPALDAYLKDNNIYNRSFGDFLKDEHHFEFFEDGTMKYDIGSTKLSKTKAIDVLHSMGLVKKGEINADALVKLVIEHCEAREADLQQKELEDNGITKRFDQILIELKSEGKIASRITQAISGEKAGKTHAMSIGQFFHHLGYSLSDKKGENTLEPLLKKPMREVIGLFKGKFQAGKLKGFDTEADFVKISKNMTENTLSIMGTHAKHYKAITGIGFNLITTAITCTVLNWAYPRIVEAFWPNLTKTENKGGDK